MRGLCVNEFCYIDSCTFLVVHWPSGLTGWHSVAASAPREASQNTNDLAREAVNCNAGLGGVGLTFERGISWL
jgi:hypothetical protein